MGEFFNIFIKAAFIENLVLAYFLGMCSYLAVSKTCQNGLWSWFSRYFCIGYHHADQLADPGIPVK
jgi:Na+-transporting NADH:ubiquinone oxidoreductase subunit E